MIYFNVRFINQRLRFNKERASNNLVNFKTRPARLKQNLAGQEQRPNQTCQVKTKPGRSRAASKLDFDLAGFFPARSGLVVELISCTFLILIISTVIYESNTHFFDFIIFHGGL